MPVRDGIPPASPPGSGPKTDAASRRHRPSSSHAAARNDSIPSPSGSAMSSSISSNPGASWARRPAANRTAATSWTEPASGSDAGVGPGSSPSRYTSSLSVNVRSAAAGARRPAAVRCSAAIASTRSALSISVWFSRRAVWVAMSMPSSPSASTASGVAAAPSQPEIPADSTVTSAMLRASSSLRSNPCAIGERQMLPVQTTRMRLTGEQSSECLPVAPSRRPRRWSEVRS